MTSPECDHEILKALAIAIVEQPRATFKELAEAVGVSKATLHRFCGTRDNLIDMLVSHTCHIMEQCFEAADLQRAPPAEALRHLISQYLAHREFLLFMVFQYRPSHMQLYVESIGCWQPSVVALDSFFLRAQQAGLFRIDISAPVMTELFMSLVCGMVEAERLGRAASSASATVLEQIFLRGVTAPD